MNFSEFEKIISEEEEENRYGGSEDSEGTLIPSIANWDRIRKAINRLANNKIKEFTKEDMKFVMAITEDGLTDKDEEVKYNKIKARAYNSIRNLNQRSKNG